MHLHDNHLSMCTVAEWGRISVFRPMKLELHGCSHHAIHYNIYNVVVGRSDYCIKNNYTSTYCTTHFQQWIHYMQFTSICFYVNIIVCLVYIIYVTLWYNVTYLFAYSIDPDVRFIASVSVLGPFLFGALIAFGVAVIIAHRYVWLHALV